MPYPTQPTGDAEHPKGPQWEHHFALNLLAHREKLRMTQTDVAKEASARGLRFYQQTIQRIEKGERPVRLNEAVVLSGVLNVPMNEMLAPPGLEPDLALALSRAVFGAEKLADRIGSAAREWLNTTVENFMSAAARKIEGDKDFGSQEPLAKLALVWLAKLLDAYWRVNSAYERMALMSGTGNASLVHDDDLLTEIVEVLEINVAGFKSEEFEQMKQLTMNELTDALNLPPVWKSRFAQTSIEVGRRQKYER